MPLWLLGAARVRARLLALAVMRRPLLHVTPILSGHVSPDIQRSATLNRRR